MSDHAMPSRRDAIGRLSLAGLALSGMGLGACAGDSGYAAMQATLRAPLPADPQIHDLIRHATLAANSHNTQPWRFAVMGSAIAIRPDLTRRTPAVDPDDHHLFVSLGCAAENLLIAAAASGKAGVAAFDAAGEGQVLVDLASGNTLASGSTARASSLQGELALAIPARQSTRSVYDGRPLSAGMLRSLEDAARMDGVTLTLITDAQGREKVLEQVIAGNDLQMADAAFMAELQGWIRFNAAEAMARRDGLYAASSGNPTLPSWLAPTAFRLAFTRAGEAKKYAEHLRSSSGVAVFTGAREDKAHWVKVGQSFQRFALRATALGIRHAHINQPIEAPALREEFARFLGAPGMRPDLVIRFGHAPVMPMSQRRPVSDVIAA